MEKELNNILNEKERILLVYAYQGNDDVYSVLQELTGLVETAGGTVIDSVTQKRNSLDPFTVLGSGKLEEVARYAEALDIDAVIFENELTPSQINNIGEVIPCKVFDRTALILDIFALQAKTAEGKLQVELAQMRYNLPRLIGSRKDLSRLGGGIGTRGPGETKLETDKRYIRKRITFLEQQIKELEKQRDIHRKRRRKNGVPCVALVGYTNAGKSSLLNALTASDVYVANKLFATLDPSARKLEFDNGRHAIIIDTVGFIRNIPTDLIAAFRSTLEEALSADIILNVCDVSDREYELHCEVTLQTLADLRCNAPVITVYNKCDRINQDTLYSGFLEGKLLVSATTGDGLDNLRKQIERSLFGDSLSVKLYIPYAKAKEIASVNEKATVIKSVPDDDGITFYCSISACHLEEFKDFLQINQ